MNKREELQTLLRATVHAFQAFAQNFTLTKTSDELFEPFTRSLKQELGEYDILYDYILGKDSVNIDGVTKNYLPQVGDTIIMDISVGRNGVWCDICRTFFVGEVSEEQEAVYEMIKQSIRSGEAALKRGAKAEDIYRAVNAVYQENGRQLVHHAGHKIGEQALLQPQFLAGNTTPVEADRAYTIESGCYDGFGIRLENDYWVGETTTENLYEPIMNLNIKEYVLYENEA
ncbi:MAG: M24 family metallopeptidase [Clostridia bacterium]|nr:M24 family metallopeptidase [Clostridia bacterium]